MQTSTESMEAGAVGDLRVLDEKLRAAIREALKLRDAELAVALNDARNFLEMAVAEPAASSSRLEMARLAAEMALATWERVTGSRNVAASGLQRD